METIQFETGKTYQARSVGDYNCIFEFVVISRTAKSIVINGSVNTKNKRCMIKIYDGQETVFPLGRYSMAPILTASKVK